jgi:hypothetical protein
MLLRSANQRRRNSRRLGCPLFSPRPTSRCHQIAQGTSNAWAFFRSWDWPSETLGKSRRKAYDHHTGPKLGQTKIGCLKQLEVDLISKTRKVPCQRCSECTEPRVKKATDIFNQHSRRSDFINQTQEVRKQVTVVLRAKLFPGNRKWGAWQTSTQQVNAAEWFSVDDTQISLIARQNVPPRTVPV